MWGAACTVHLLAVINLINAESHTHAHKNLNSEANRQANAHKLVHMFAHRLTETSLFFHASSNLGPSIKMMVRHQNRRLISATKHIQETFSPHEWGIESALSGKLSMKVCLSMPDNQILPLALTPASLQELSYFSFIASNHPPRKKKKETYFTTMSKAPCVTLMQASSQAGSTTQQRGTIRYRIPWQLIL